VHMPFKEVREWRRTIQHLRNLVNTMTQTKNRIRSLLKSQGLKRSHRGGWWNGTNRAWMRQEAERDGAPWREVL
jgi:transposase